MADNGESLRSIGKNRLFGFLLGSTLAGAGVYGYVLREYKASNELLTEDIYVRPLQPPLSPALFLLYHWDCAKSSCPPKNW